MNTIDVSFFNALSGEKPEEKIRVAEGVNSGMTEHQVQSGRTGQKKIDPKKLILYSEIMRPKFDE